MCNVLNMTIGLNQLECFGWVLENKRKTARL